MSSTFLPRSNPFLDARRKAGPGLSTAYLPGPSEDIKDPSECVHGAPGSTLSPHSLLAATLKHVHQEHSPENPHGLQGGIYHLRQQLPKTGHLDICTQTMCRTIEAQPHLPCWAVTSTEGTFASPLKSQSTEDKPCSPWYLGSGR